MLTIPLLLIVLVIPAVFWIYGKRLFGNQTHPAALFILAWIASSFLLGMAPATEKFSGIGGLLWVTLTFVVLSLVRKRKQEPPAESQEK